MKNKRIPNIAKSALDAQICEIVQKASENELGGKPMVLAIQNENGEVYRVITAQGLNTYLMLVNALANLGLKDLHADILHPGEYDSLFVFN
ncbi:hypothetical protein [Hafnia alvei]|uniref:hypothetical protein n=1 Tax=Hafnia alvei TaxID=569 RepID=UPI001034ABD5|nr:hypothetical protein [Hafnia alvei]QIP55422.1 hypothetical protein HBA19_07275 [Hafnia alvei]TBL53980.1 hypothetical protein EYY98_01910 [Obesumbacterium proteus]